MTDCTKCVYPTQWAASRALKAIQRKLESRGGKVPTGSYLCTSCRGWHLTSKSKSQIPPWVRARTNGQT